MTELWLVPLHRERVTTLWLQAHRRPISSSSEALMTWLCDLDTAELCRYKVWGTRCNPGSGRRALAGKTGAQVSLCHPGTYNTPVSSGSGKITVSENCVPPRPMSCSSVLPFWLSQVCGMYLSFSALFRSLIVSGSLAICVSRMDISFS